MAVKKNSEPEGRGHFFAVQRDAWAAVCRHDSMNEAVAYLVLARGSNFGTRRTSWSVDSVERYTGIARGRAKTAIEGLVRAGLIVRTRAGTKPQYYLPLGGEIERVYSPGAETTAAGRHVYERLKATKDAVTFAEGEVVPAGSEDGEPAGEVADALERKGVLLQIEEGGYFTNPDLHIVRPADMIWLPNSLVDGVSKLSGPVEQVRQTQDRLALRVLVDLYYWQSLASDGGLHWLTVREEYEKIRVGQSGPYDVWGFRSAGVILWGTAPFVQTYLSGVMEDIEGAGGETWEQDTGIPAVGGALKRLRDLGLVQYVPHLIDADSAEGEIIHPCPPSTGEAREQAIAEAALNAAYRLIPDGKADWVDGKGLAPIVPLHRHRGGAELVGLLRLTHRARTAATGKWLGNAGEWAKWVATYNEIRPGT